MDTIIIKAAAEVGLAAHVAVSPFDGCNPLVTVSFPPKSVQSRIPVHTLTQADLSQLKIILSDMGRWVQSR